MKIRVVEYARSPGGRFRSDGPFSGEWFREEIVRPALTEAVQAGDRLEVELDGTSGYGSRSWKSVLAASSARAHSSPISSGDPSL
jgi:hypothetical protein